MGIVGEKKLGEKALTRASYSSIQVVSSAKVIIVQREVVTINSFYTVIVHMYLASREGIFTDVFTIAIFFFDEKKRGERRNWLGNELGWYLLFLVG